MRLDGYIRVSRVGGREGEGYISPDVQREAIQRYAGELGGSIVAWHADEDYSGGNTERPGFQEVLERLERGETDGVVVMRIDRFARSTADGSRIVREIVDREQIFASCHERIDPRTPEGGYMLRSFLSNAELFLDQIKASWKTAKGRAIARGAHIGPTPNGYLKVEAIPSKPTHISPIDSAARGGPTDPGLLVPRPIYGPAMTQLFDRSAGGAHGDTALARWMTETAPREGGAPWNANEVRRWLSNRVYLGEVKYDVLVNRDAHEPLTDEATWKRCQREPGERRHSPSPFLLKGLVRCAGCRYAMGGQTNGGAGGETPIYRCPRSSKGCPEPSVITAARIETFVKATVDQRQAGMQIAQTESDTADREAIDRFEAAEEEVAAFVADVQARRLMGEDAWQEGLRLRAAEREARRPAREVALARQESRHLAHRNLADLDREALRDLLVGMVRHIFVRRRRGATASDRVLIVWSDDVRVIEIPRAHNRIGPFEPVRW